MEERQMNMFARRPLINGFGQMAIFNGLGKCLADACWLAAGKQPKLKVICPKTIKYGHLPKTINFSTTEQLTIFGKCA